MQGDSVREGWVIVAPAPDIYQIRGGMFLKISKMLLIFPYRLDKLHRYNLDVKAKLFCPEIAGLFCRIAGLFCHDSRANLSLKPVCFGIAIS